MNALGEYIVAYGKTIELFLVNGTADSLTTAELSNWNGKAIKIPRTEVAECEREDIQGVGVYFLFCQEDDGTDSVYIGEAENVLIRLKQHLSDFKAGKEKYYWNTAVAFLGRDLNKALGRYLEDQLFHIAKKCNRYKILTKATYNTTIKESQRASMEEFMDNIKILLNALGYKVLTPVPQATSTTTYLYCKSSDASAKGFISIGGFTVLKGSTISNRMAPSFPTGAKSYYNLRNQLIADGIIINGVFEQDYEFNAPSAASAVVLGRASNGKLYWKTEDGKTLKEIL